MRVMTTHTWSMGHRLLGLPEGHKCGRMHGHSYRAEFDFESDSLDLDVGWMEDFGTLDQIIKPVIERLDHYTVLHPEDPRKVALENDGEVVRTLTVTDTRAELGNPTAENIARWLLLELQHPLHVKINSHIPEPKMWVRLARVRVWEGERRMAEEEMK